MTAAEPQTMPMQLYGATTGTVPTPVVMLAYEVYCALYGKQEAMITGGCRGGFGVGELLAFLYARNFPKDQWNYRLEEALAGMITDPRR